MSVNLVLLGKPASGKGTQGEIIAPKYNLVLLTGGSLLRKFSQHDSVVGRSIKESLEKGDLVPDALIMWVVQEALRDIDPHKGVIFDGIPRVLNQAFLLEEKLKELERELSAIMYVQVSDETVIERITGRRICTQSDQHIFHLEFNPPQKEGICDICGAPLMQRSDDSAAHAQYRLKVYNEQTAPVVEHYRSQGQLYTVDGEKSIIEVTQQIESFLNELVKKLAN
jgi:adenylate kinase